MTRDTKLYVADILDSIDTAVGFTTGTTLESFLADRRTAYAVVRCFEIIGEAAKNVPEDVRALAPGIPWRDMAGMRDRCVHGYFGVRYETVWTTVTEDLPSLRPQLQGLLARL